MDKLFVPHKPPGSKHVMFTLAYEPGNFDSALKEYNSWMEKLITYDWPIFFGNCWDENWGPMDKGNVVENAKLNLDSKQKCSISSDIDLIKQQNVPNTNSVLLQSKSSPVKEIPVMIDPNIFIPTTLDQVVKVQKSSVSIFIAY